MYGDEPFFFIFFPNSLCLLQSRQQVYFPFSSRVNLSHTCFQREKKNRKIFFGSAMNLLFGLLGFSFSKFQLYVGVWLLCVAVDFASAPKMGSGFSVRIPADCAMIEVAMYYMKSFFVSFIFTDLKLLIHSKHDRTHLL